MTNKRDEQIVCIEIKCTENNPSSSRERHFPDGFTVDFSKGIHAIGIMVESEQNTVQE